MLEEQNDNLQNADGNLINEMNDSIGLENNDVNVTTTEEIVVEEVKAEEVKAFETVAEDIVNEQSIEESQPHKVEENTIELTDEQLADDTLLFESSPKSAIETIEESNAEESEDETLKNRHEIPMLDYDTMSLQQLVDELEKLVVVEKVMSVKDHVEELKKAFFEKYNHFIEEKKEAFEHENPDTTEDFHYSFPLKTKWVSVLLCFLGKVAH